MIKLYITCEAKLNETENENKVRKLLTFLVNGEIKKEKRSDGTYLVILTSEETALANFYETIRSQRLLDTIRTRMLRNKEYGGMTSLYFNRQALWGGKLSLVDFEDEPPLGPVLLQIVAGENEDIDEIIDKLAPKTYRGKELTEEEWREVRRKEAERRAREKAKSERKSAKKE